MKRKPEPQNAWLLGYKAAMRASSIELTDAGLTAALETAHERYTLGDFAVSMFREGWHSALKCERRHEVAS